MLHQLRLPAPPAKRARLQGLRVAPPGADEAAAGQEQPSRSRSSPGHGDDFGPEPSDACPLPNDALVALQLFVSKFPPEAGVAPFATRAQLYSKLSDRTRTDRQLEELRRKNAVRVLQLPTGRDEGAVMLTGDYAAAALRCKREAEQRLRQAQPQAANADNDALAVFDWFAERVLPACTDTMVTHGELLLLLAGRAAPGGVAAPQQQQQKAPAAAVSERHVSLLLSYGLLTRHTAGADGYLFSMPSAGPAVQSVAAGRQELLQLLRRRRQPEMLEAELLKRRLQRSRLGVRWHLDDMLGSGALLRIPTTVGPLLRVAPRAG